MINTFVHAMRARGRNEAKRRIGVVVLNGPRRLFSGPELRERTKLRRWLLYQTLENLVDAKWLGVEPVYLSGRRQNAYYVTDRGLDLFPAVLADHDIHSGDKSWRQVWSFLCASNASTRSRSSSYVKPVRR